MNTFGTTSVGWRCPLLFVILFLATAILELGCGSSPTATTPDSTDESSSALTYVCWDNQAADDSVNSNVFLGYCLAYRGKQPIVGFGLAKAPGGKPAYTYFLIYRDADAAPEAGLAPAFSGEGDSDGKVHKLSGKVFVGRCAMDLAYKFSFDKDKKSWSADEIKLGGRDLSGDATRVFLSELRGDKVTLTPVIVPQELFVPQHNGKEGDMIKAWCNGALETLEQFKLKVPEVKKFLE